MAVLKRISPYAKDEMNLPVKKVDESVSFYENIMGFQVVSKAEIPCKKIILKRDDHSMAIAENGGDPSQEGCFIEVDSVEEMFEELQLNGLKQDKPNYRIDTYGENSYKVFFLVAPDGLCYCIGELQIKQ